MRITYVLSRPELGGGNKVIAQHATLLQGAGFLVTLIGDGPRPQWMPFTGPYLDSSLAPPRLPSQDLVIGTYWTTLAVATRLGAGPVAHFCQGYEGRFSHLRSDWPDIEAVYRRRVPTLTVTPSLGEYLADRFDRPWRVASPVLDPLFRPRYRWRPRRRPWIVVPGVFEAEVKDVATALGAVHRLRATGVACRLLRISTLPLSVRERAIMEPDRYLYHAHPHEVARAVRACDLLLFPPRSEEGFGLPLLEAMASGVPAIASRIPSVEFMTMNAVPVVTPGDEAGFADAARTMLGDPTRWRRARREGSVAARQFAPARIGAELLSAVHWAASSGSGRSTT